jgi:hypothetical protein
LADTDQVRPGEGTLPGLEDVERRLGFYDA